MFIRCFKMAELLLNGKKLDDLKVSELKDELDKRDLSKKGNKSALLERLRKVVLSTTFYTSCDRNHFCRLCFKKWHQQLLLQLLILTMSQWSSMLLKWRYVFVTCAAIMTNCVFANKYTTSAFVYI